MMTGRCNGRTLKALAMDVQHKWLECPQSASSHLLQADRGQSVDAQSVDLGGPHVHLDMRRLIGCNARTVASCRPPRAANSRSRLDLKADLAMLNRQTAQPNSTNEA